MFRSEPPRPGMGRPEENRADQFYAEQFRPDEFRPDEFRLEESRSQTYRSDPSRTDPSRPEGGRVNPDVDLDDFAPRGRSERGRGDGRGDSRGPGPGPEPWDPDRRGRDGRTSEGRAPEGRNAPGRDEDDLDLDRPTTTTYGRGQDREAASSRSAGRASASGRGGSRGASHSGGGNGSGGGNRKLAVIGGTVGVVVLALVAYFLTRPSGGSTATGATADATTSQSTGVTQSSPAAAGSSAPASPSSGASASTSAKAGSSASATTGTVTVIKSEVHVAVFNGSNIDGRAAAIKTALVTDGFTLATVGGTLPKTVTTKIYYPATRADSAATVAKALDIPAANLALSTAYTQVTLVLGTDWTTGTTYPAG